MVWALAAAWAGDAVVERELQLPSSVDVPDQRVVYAQRFEGLSLGGVPPVVTSDGTFEVACRTAPFGVMMTVDVVGRYPTRLPESISCVIGGTELRAWVVPGPARQWATMAQVVGPDSPAVVRHQGEEGVIGSFAVKKRWREAGRGQALTSAGQAWHGVHCHARYGVEVVAVPFGGELPVGEGVCRLTKGRRTLDVPVVIENE